MQHLYFKEFIVLQRGFDLPKKEMCDGPYPVVGSTSIIGFHNEYKIEPPGVVTGRSGSLGFVQYIRERYWPHNTSLWVKDFKGNLPQYVFYFLKTLDLQRFNSGVGVPTLNRNDLDTFEVSIHPINTQCKIAAILSAYDDLIKNNLRRIKILEEMAQNIYTEWFVRFRFPEHEKVKMIDSTLGRIPEGWQCEVVNSLLSLKSGFAFKGSIFVEDGTYGLVTIRNVHDGLFVPDCSSRIANLPSNMPSYCHLSTGDVLLSLTGNVGRVCLVYGNDYVLNQRVAKLVPNEANNRAFSYFTFRQNEFQTKLSNIANGVAQQNLSPIETGKMPLVIPTQKVLADFAVICEPIIEEITTLFQKSANLRQTRDLLLPKLISGELDVSDLDIKTGDDE